MFVSSAFGSDLRTFTNQEGQTIQARMVRLEGDIAVIQREDQRLFRLPVESLSEEDQAFVRRWPVLNAVASNREVEIRMRRLRLGRVTERESPVFPDAVSFRGSRDELVFQIVFNNLSQQDLTDLTVEYRIFKDLAPHNSLETRDFLLRPERVVRKGTVRLEHAERRKETIVMTEPFFLVETDREIWGAYDPNLDRRRTIVIKRQDVLYGIWIRVMDGDKVIREEVSSQNIPRRFSWD